MEVSVGVDKGEVALQLRHHQASGLVCRTVEMKDRVRTYVRRRLTAVAMLVYPQTRLSNTDDIPFSSSRPASVSNCLLLFAELLDRLVSFPSRISSSS